MSVKIYRLKCDYCDYNRWSDGSDVSDMAVVETCKSCKNSKKFKCPNCGRLIAPKRYQLDDKGESLKRFDPS